MTTSEKIKFIRMSQGMTQRDLARATGIHQSRISQIELGQQPSQRKLEAICRVLNTTPEAMEGDNAIAFRVRMEKHAYMPQRDKESAGFVLRAKEPAYIPRRGSVTVNTGLVVTVPESYTGFVCASADLRLPHGVMASGIVESGESVPVLVKLVSFCEEAYYIYPGEKLGKLFFVPTPEAGFVKKAAARGAAVSRKEI